MLKFYTIFLFFIFIFHFSFNNLNSVNFLQDNLISRNYLVIASLLTYWFIFPSQISVYLNYNNYIQLSQIGYFYLFIKGIIEFLLMIFIPSLIFSNITYFLLGFDFFSIIEQMEKGLGLLGLSMIIGEERKEMMFPFSIPIFILQDKNIYEPIILGLIILSPILMYYRIKRRDV